MHIGIVKVVFVDDTNSLANFMIETKYVKTFKRYMRNYKSLFGSERSEKRPDGRRQTINVQRFPGAELSKLGARARKPAAS